MIFVFCGIADIVLLIVVNEYRKCLSLFIIFVTADVQRHFISLPVQQTAGILICIFLIQYQIRILIMVTVIDLISRDSEVHQFLQNRTEFRIL